MNFIKYKNKKLENENQFVNKNKLYGFKKIIYIYYNLFKCNVFLLWSHGNKFETC